MDTSAAVPAAMQTYLDNCTPQQVQDIIQHIQGLSHQHAAREKSSMTVKAASVFKKQRSKKSKASKGGPKRPLNSWMAFRKFYEGSLSPATQKAISTVLSSYWRADPFHAKWTILAKAYSIVRGDREKEEAPLDDFLALCTPLMGMITPDEYEEKMGWSLGEKDKDGIPQITRIFTPSLESFSVELTSTTLSAEDLVQTCAEAGLMDFEVEPGHFSQDILSMAVQPNAPVNAPAAPSPQAAPFENVDSQVQNTKHTTDTSLMQDHTATASATANNYAVDAPIEFPVDWTQPETGHELAAIAAFNASFQGTQVQSTVGGLPSGAAELGYAQQNFANAGASYPFNDLFSPSTNSFNVTFEPSQINNDPLDNSSFDAHEASVYDVQNFDININFDEFINQEQMG